MNSPPARSYPKRGQRTTTSYSGRRQRRSAGATSRHPVFEQSSGAAQKWTRVLRNPTSPLGEPYFGSGPTASFQIPMWVRISDLTEEEKLRYEEAERKKEDKRMAWKKAIEERRSSEADTTGEDENEGGETKDNGVNESIHRQSVSKYYEITDNKTPADEANIQNHHGLECIDEFFKCEERSDCHEASLSSTKLTEQTAMDSTKPAEEAQDASLTIVPTNSEPYSASDDTPMEVDNNEHANNTEPQHQQH
ncbi:hypothetical protein ACHAWX_001166 [Stephanocyclus meneghinianus]